MCACAEEQDESVEQKYSRFVAALSASVDIKLSCNVESQTFLLATTLDARFKLKLCTASEYHSLKDNLISKIKTAKPISNEMEAAVQSIHCSFLDDIPIESTHKEK